MSDWGRALAGGIAAAAKSGSDALGQQINMQAQADAEKRAADLRLNTEERLYAIKQAQQQRADERYVAIVKQKMGEPVPVEAPSVAQTGLTRDSAAAAGLTQGGFAGGMDKIGAIISAAQTTLDNPTATAQQKQDAAALIEQMDKQTAAQGDVNAKSVEGKTRARTTGEAHKAALDWASVNSPQDYRTGMAMMEPEIKNEREDKRIDNAAKRDDARTKMMMEGWRTRERMNANTVAERANYHESETERKTAADKSRAEIARARAEAITGGKGEKATALIKNREYLINKTGRTAEEADRILFQSKDPSEATQAFKLMAADKFGDLTPESALEKVRKVRGAAAPSSGKATTVPNPVKSGIPAGWSVKER